MDKIIFTTSNELTTLITGAVANAFREHQKNNRKIEKTFLIIDEASDYLNLAKQTIYGYTSQNKIPHIKKGKKLYFVKEDIDKWLAGGKREI